MGTEGQKGAGASPSKHGQGLSWNRTRGLRDGPTAPTPGFLSLRNVGPLRGRPSVSHGALRPGPALCQARAGGVGMDRGGHARGLPPGQGGGAGDGHSDRGCPLWRSQVHAGCSWLCRHHFMQQALGRGTVGSPGSTRRKPQHGGRSGLCRVTELRVAELGWLNWGPEPAQRSGGSRVSSEKGEIGRAGQPSSWKQAGSAGHGCSWG